MRSDNVCSEPPRQYVQGVIYKMLLLLLQETCELAMDSLDDVHVSSLLFINSIDRANLLISANMSNRLWI